MRAFSAILAIVILMTGFSRTVVAREAANPRMREMKESPRPQSRGLVDPGLRDLHEAAAVDTYCLVAYDFGGANWQGWTSVDRTAQPDTFFHVDDFAGLGGGDFGGLVPLEGTKSMWCGARANLGDPYLCGWHSAPGYGNGWSQDLQSAAFTFTGQITVSFKISWDTEPDYDITRLQYDDGGGVWTTVEGAEYTSYGTSTDEYTINPTRSATKLRFHMTSNGEWSDRGYWGGGYHGSDEDGFYNSDGACIVDAISVSDEGTLSDYEDFETAAVGAHGSGIWHAGVRPPFGTYSHLRNALQDRDPCGENLSWVVAFFDESAPHPGPSYPGLYDTPFCRGDGRRAPCQDEIVVSPPIDTRRFSTGRNHVQDGVIPAEELPSLGGLEYRFMVYADLPFDNLVLCQWYARNIIDGRPGPWIVGDNFYRNKPTWLSPSYDVSYYIVSDTVQVAVGVVDMCDVWHEMGNCAAHTPAPWFGNIGLYRYNSAGPQWEYYDENLFQDNFPPDEAMTGFVRADAAVDINPSDNPLIHPGDSVVVRCLSPTGGGIAGDAGGPRVYMHVRCRWISYPVKPPLAGSQLLGSCGRYVSDDGTWTIIQCDTARVRGIVYTDRYMADLNDALFTSGYMIEYYFRAYDNAGESSALPMGADHFTAESPYFGSSYYFEFTCLPTFMSQALYVDDFHGIGSFDGVVQSYFDRTVPDVSDPPSMIDRYDVLAPTSLVSNGLASRVRASQLDSVYYAIVWDSGDLSSGTITDGTPESGDKTNDCQLLVDFMNLAPYRYYYPTGVWIMGDNVAEELSALSSPQAFALMSNACGVSLVNGSYFDMTGGEHGGGVVNPFITGVSSWFVHGLAHTPDTFYVFGGCPAISSFDVLEATGGAEYALKYREHDGQQRYAGIESEKTNSNGRLIRTMWFGFSFMSIRDCIRDVPIIRNTIAHSVLRYYFGVVPSAWDLAGSSTPKAYRLAQNFPNPFNPTTTIKYDMKAKGLVRIRLYNVAGQLVRTLVDEVKEAGAYTMGWDGTNDRGSAVASGIYFYKMETGGFSATKKLVLLR